MCQEALVVEEQFLFIFFVFTILTFIIAIFDLLLFWKDKLSRFIGVLSIKPIIAYWFGSITLFLIQNWIGWCIFYAMFEFGLSLLLLFRFISLYQQSDRLLRFFTMLDFARWIAMLLILLSGVIFGVETINREIVRSIASGIIFYSVLFAIFGFLFGIIRRKQSRTVAQESNQ